MANNHTFSYEQNTLYREKTYELYEILPGYVADFINAKYALEKFTPKTCLSYARDIKLFFDYLTDKGSRYEGMQVDDITLPLLEKVTYQDIIDYLAKITVYRKDEKERRNSASAKARKLASIRSLYNYYVKLHIIENNPCLAVETPKEKDKPIITLSEKEESIFLHTLNTGDGLTPRQQAVKEHQKFRDYIIITLSLTTGIRVSELVGIDIDDINSVEKSIIISRKGGKTQNIYLKDEVYSDMMDYIDHYRRDFYPTDDVRAVFLNRAGERISARSVENIVKKYANAALGKGNKISPHKLRSTFGTKLYKATDDIYLVADALGHSDVSTTVKHYAKMGEEHRKSVPNKI